MAYAGVASRVAYLSRNRGLQRLLQFIKLPNVDLLSFPVNGHSLPVMRFTPSDGLGPSRAPTLVYAYNGPLVQLVTAQHPLLFNGGIGRWLIYLVENFGFQVSACCVQGMLADWCGFAVKWTASLLVMYF